MELTYGDSRSEVRTSWRSLVCPRETLVGGEADP
jgi:hypothetical protein